MLKTLLDKVTDLNRELQENIQKREERLFAADTGLQALFEKELDDQAADFPAKWNLLRGRWGGQGEVAQKLESYRQDLRTLATETVMARAMERLGTALGRQLAIVDLIAGPNCAQSVLLERQRKPDKVFKEEGQRLGIRHYVIHTKEDIERLVVRRILERPPIKGVHTEPVARLFQAKVMETWAGKGDIVGKVEKLDVLLERTGTMNVAAAWDDIDIREVVRGLGKALEMALTEASRTIIGREIQEYSAWDGIRLVVESGTTDREAMLTDLFSTYARTSSLFSKLNGKEKQDGFYTNNKIGREMRLLCDMEEAKACFQALGLDHVELDTLLLRSFRVQPSILPNPGQRDIVLFYKERGHNPKYFTGFEGLQSILCADPKEQKADIKRWSDRRWPEWIRAVFSWKIE